MDDVGGAGDVDAAGSEDGAVVVVYLDIHQVGGFAAGDDARPGSRSHPYFYAQYRQYHY